MDRLTDIVRDTVFAYAGGGFNLKVYPVSNEPLGIYAINVLNYPDHDRPGAIALSARIDGDRVIIEEDVTDRPLADALVAAGIPREKIVLAYLGEVVSRESA
jgi:hypothetical protein